MRYRAIFSVSFAVLFATAVIPSASSLALKWSSVDGTMLETAPLEIIEAEHQDVIEESSGVLEGYVQAIVNPPSQKPKTIRKTLKIGKGDTLAGVLEDAGVSGSDTYYAIKALSHHYSPKKIKPGQVVRVLLSNEDSGETAFKKAEFKIDPLKTISVARGEDGVFTSDLVEAETVLRRYAQTAEIETSLFGSAARAGIPSQVIANIIRVYSWNVDFQRDIRRGDTIKVLYEMNETEDGSYQKLETISFANLSIGGKEVPIYRYETGDGDIDYFEPNGRSIRKVLMKTPIDGARISSGYGMRHHPVLGYNKMHKGVDFAASVGTPIYAAGDGTIDYAGRKGAYGNYIRIRHNSSLKTAYAHMHRLAKGMGNGTRVKQGQIIGYVGTTGRSTGPHLHYEVVENGRQVNPNSINLPIGKELKGAELARFQDAVSRVDRQYVSINQQIKLADKESKRSHLFR